MSLIENFKYGLEKVKKRINPVKLEKKVSTESPYEFEAIIFKHEIGKTVTYRWAAVKMEDGNLNLITEDSSLQTLLFMSANQLTLTKQYREKWPDYYIKSTKMKAALLENKELNTVTPGIPYLEIVDAIQVAPSNLEDLQEWSPTFDGGLEKIRREYNLPNIPKGVPNVDYFGWNFRFEIRNKFPA